MKKEIRLLFMFCFLLSQLNTFSQIYKDDIRYEGGAFYPSIPPGYKFYLKGYVQNSVKQVNFQIEGEPLLKWTRSSTVEDEFTILVPAINSGNKRYFIYMFSRLIDDTTFEKNKETFKNAAGSLLKKQLITEHGITFADSKKFDVETDEEDKSVFSPVVGIGMGVMGKQPNVGNDLIAYTAFKLRLRKVNKTARFTTDREQEIVYGKDLLKRTSILFGGIISNVAYKGQLLGNPVLDFKPLLGFSFDITLDVSIDFGGFLFDYLDSDPSLKPDYAAKCKLGCFIAVSIDADLFNRLSLLLKNKSYNKGK